MTSNGYVYVIARSDFGGNVEVIVYDDHDALPGKVTSTQVRHAREAPTQVRTPILDDGRSWLGYLPVNKPFRELREHLLPVKD